VSNPQVTHRSSVAPPGLEPGLSWSRTTSAFAAAPRAFVVWTVPSPSPLRGQVAPTQSLRLPPLGAWLGVASQGFADFESIHARRFWRGVQRVHRRCR